MFAIRAAFLAAFFQICLTAASWAQDVTLTSRDGSVEISGSLAGYDGEFYRVSTAYGILTVDGSGVLCEGPGCPDLSNFVAQVRISGSQAPGQSLMPRLLDAFARNSGYEIARQIDDDARFTYVLKEGQEGRDVARFTFDLANSGEGFADLIADEADATLSVREIDDKEYQRGTDAGLGDLRDSRQARVIALDALVPVVSYKNAIRAISPTNLYDVFAGKITNWNVLGGADAPIDLHLASVDRGLAQMFLANIAGGGGSLAKDIRRHQSVRELVDVVSDDPFAIGIATKSELGNAKPLTLAGSCGFLSTARSDSLKTEDYPLTAPVFLYLPPRRQPKVMREFLRFTTTPAAQVAILQAGLSDQALSEIPMALQGDRLMNAIQSAGEDIVLGDLQAMVKSLEGARRLTVGFRFKDGSADLDAQSRSNVALVARGLEAGNFDERQIIFVGFSDGVGPAPANSRLSRERATSVRDAVMREAATVDLARLSIKVLGFGEAMPMACDDTDWGRQVNRRVEVWVR